MDWTTSNNQVYVYEAYNPNRFSVRDQPFTDEEKAAFRALKETQTVREKLRDLMLESFMSNWKATELCQWMDLHTQGYQVRRGRDNGVLIQFASRAHAALFKLVWA